MPDFEVRPSSVTGAGDGLWALRDIPAGAIFPVRHSRKRATSVAMSSAYVLDAYLRDQTDVDSECVQDGRVTTLRCLDKIDDECFRPAFFHVNTARESFMKANDLAWRDGIDEVEYTLRTRANSVDLINGFDKDGKIVTIYAYFRHAVCRGQEIGITYGIGYWSATA